jgi:hypothetical protein
MTRLLILALVCIATPASADSFEPLDQLGQVGLGAARHGDDLTFDGNLRIGHSVHATGPIWAGGFGELHTFGFDTYDLSIGPQAQLRLSDLFAVQLRAGVGIGSDGPQAIVGGQFGTWLMGASVTARRSFDTDETIVSFNVELTALLPALPLALLVPATR